MRDIAQDINLAQAGEDSPLVIYWDESDVGNEGPAYRYKDGSDSGSLEYWVWSKPLVASAYSIEDFFLNNCEYSGPDELGVYPIFEVT